MDTHQVSSQNDDQQSMDDNTKQCLSYIEYSNRLDSGLASLDSGLDSLRVGSDRYGFDTPFENVESSSLLPDDAHIHGSSDQYNEKDKVCEGSIHF